MREDTEDAVYTVEIPFRTEGLILPAVQGWPPSWESLYPMTN